MKVSIVILYLFFMLCVLVITIYRLPKRQRHIKCYQKTIKKKEYFKLSSTAFFLSSKKLVQKKEVKTKS